MELGNSSPTQLDAIGEGLEADSVVNMSKTAGRSGKVTRESSTLSVTQDVIIL